MFLTEQDEFGKRRKVAIHRKQAVGHYERFTTWMFCAKRQKLIGQCLHVEMRIDMDICPAQSRSIHDRGMIEGIGKNRIART